MAAGARNRALAVNVSRLPVSREVHHAAILPGRHVVGV